jgi:hypothetical protein
MKYPVTAPDKNGFKQSIDQFLDLILSSGRNSFKADDDFRFSLEDFRFEIYNPETGLFHDFDHSKKKDIIGSISDPLHSYKIVGSSINTETFASHLRDCIVEYEPRLKNVTVGMDLYMDGVMLLVSVSGIIDDGYETPYTFYKKIRIW